MLLSVEFPHFDEICNGFHKHFMNRRVYEVRPGDFFQNLRVTTFQVGIGDISG